MKMLAVFKKGERLRHIGHLDLMRAIHRALRRSDLPIEYSKGFNPHILLNIAAPLSLYTYGSREVMEVPLEKDITKEAFMSALSGALPQDIVLLSAKPIADNHPASMSLLHAASYDVFLKDFTLSQEDLDRFLAQENITVLKKSKSKLKECDIRPMIYELKMKNPNTLHMVLALGEKATCKPDLLLTSLSDFLQVQKPRTLIERTALLGLWQNELVPLENL